MAAITLDHLSRFPFMAGFDDALLARIARRLHRQQYPAQTAVFSQNDESRDVYWVLSGHLRLSTYSLAGREVVYHDLYPGDIVGELSAVDGRPRGANLIAVTNAELVCLEAAVFNRLTVEHTAFALALIDRLTGLARKLNGRIVQLTAPVPTRICAELLRLAEHHRIADGMARLAPPPKHLDIANRVNTHREAVSRTLADLQRAEIVRRGPGELAVLNMASLRACAEGTALQPKAKSAGEIAMSSGRAAAGARSGRQR